MNKKLGILLIAGVAIASSCGGGDSEGRTRNAVIERDVECFATEQDKTDTMNAMSERRAALAAAEGDVDKFNIEWKRLNDRVSQAWNNQVAHPEWNIRGTGELTVKGRQEIINLGLEYNAALNEYNALYEVHTGRQSLNEALAYYDTKYSKVNSTNVCEPSTTLDISTTVDTPTTMDTPTTLDIPTTVDTPTTMDTPTTVDTSPVNVFVANYDCPAPIITGPTSVVISSVEKTRFEFSSCEGAVLEIRVASPSPLPKFTVIDNTMVTIFTEPGVHTVGARFTKNDVAVSRFGIITVQVDAPSTEVPCKGKAPLIKVSEDFNKVTFTSTCEGTSTIAYELNLRISSVSSIGLRAGRAESGQPVDINVPEQFGRGAYEIRAAHHVAVFEGGYRSYGDWATDRFVVNSGGSESFGDNDQTVTDMPVPALQPSDSSPSDSMSSPSSTTDDSTTTSTVDSSSPVSGSPMVEAVAVPQSVESVKCDEKCITAVTEKSGIAESEVKSLEVSVFEGLWVPLQVNSDILLTGQVTNLAVRVTPKSGDAVVLRTTIHKGSVAQTPLQNTAVTSLSQVVYVDSSNPEGAYTLSEAESTSFLVANWWKLLLILILLLFLFFQLRKRSAVKVANADTR